MKLNVLFLGVLKYKDKKTGDTKIRISYIVNDEKAKQETSNFKGLNECAYYSDNIELFDKFVKEDSLTTMEFSLENRPSQNNPLKTITQVTEIHTKRGTIKLI